MDDDDDPILRELRAHRDAQASRFGFDLDRMADDLQRREREHPERFAGPGRSVGPGTGALPVTGPVDAASKRAS